MTLAIRPPRLYGQIPRGPLRVDWSNGLTAGLKAFWTFDATQGGFVDVSNRKTLTPTGSPTIVPSAGGPAVRLNGSTQYIASASDLFLDANDFVVIVGVTPRGSLVQFAPIITRWNETGNLRCWSIVCNANTGAIRADTSTGVSITQTVTTGTGLLVVDKRVVIGYLGQGTAHGTNQPLQAAIWVDGIRQGQSTIGGGNALTGSNNPVHIGHSPRWSSAERFGQYDVDFVAIWNRYLMPAQLSSLTRDPGQILIASQPSPAFGPLPPVNLEWGFEPVLPIAQRDWFNRAAGVMPGANVEAPLFDFLPAGWEVQLPQPPRRPWERSAASLPASLNLDAEFIFLSAPIAHEWGFENQPPQPPRQRWERVAAALPAAVNLDAAYIFVTAPIPHEWGFENQPPQPPRRFWENVAASLPAALNLDAEFIFVAAADIPHEWGFQPQPPQPPRRRWERVAAALPAALNLNARFLFVSSVPFQWDGAAQPLLLPRRRWERLAAGLPAAFNVSTLSSRQRPQILVIIG